MKHGVNYNSGNYNKISLSSESDKHVKSSQVRGSALKVPVTRVWTDTWGSVDGSYRPISPVAAIGAVDRRILLATANGSAIHDCWWIVTIRDATGRVRVKCRRIPRSCSGIAETWTSSSAIRIDLWEDVGEAGDGKRAEGEGATAPPLLWWNGECSSSGFCVAASPASVSSLTLISLPLFLSPISLRLLYMYSICDTYSTRERHFRDWSCRNFGPIFS